MGIEAVEAALIAALQNALGSYVRKIESLPGGWSEEIVARVEREAPAAYVVFLRGLRGVQTHEAVINGQYAVYLVNTNAIGQVARREGDGKKLGTLALVQAAISAIQGLTIEDHGTAELLAVENLWEGAFERKNLSIYAAVWQIPTTVGPVSLPDGLGDFETFDAVYELPGNEAAAEDTVTMETE
jgi:phage gp37-like protein